jgi:hypothetical protein
MIETIEMQAMADFIVDNSAHGLGAEAVADLFDRMVWILKDNGEALHRVVRRWLDEGTDLRRVQIALAMEEAFLYERRSEMEAAFLQLTLRYPELEATCQSKLAEWDASGYPHT